MSAVKNAMSSRASFTSRIKSAYNDAPNALRALVAVSISILAGCVVFIAVEGIAHAIDNKDDGYSDKSETLTSGASSGGYENRWDRPSSSPSIAPSINDNYGNKPSTNIHHSFIPSQAPTIMPTIAKSSFPSLVTSLGPSKVVSSPPSVMNTDADEATGVPVIPSRSPSGIIASLDEPTDAPNDLTTQNMDPTYPPLPLSSDIPTRFISFLPSTIPRYDISPLPTSMASFLPTSTPSVSTSTLPSSTPTIDLSPLPSTSPSLIASSSNPTLITSFLPTSTPSVSTSKLPSFTPTIDLSALPSTSPSLTASSSNPTSMASFLPTSTPSVSTSKLPSSTPTIDLSALPSTSPSPRASNLPSLIASSSFPSIAPSSSHSPTLSSKPSNHAVSFYVGSGPLKSFNSTEISDTAKFIVHLGDMFDQNWCGDFPINETKKMLLESPIPIFLTPGEKDWMQCENSIESLHLWQENFVGFEDNWLDTNTIDVKRDGSRTENFAFLESGILFVGVNIIDEKGKKKTQNEVQLNALVDDALNFFMNEVELFEAEILATVIMSHGRGDQKYTKHFSESIKKIVQLRYGEISIPIMHINGASKKWNVVTNGNTMILDLPDRSGFSPALITVSTGNQESPFEINELAEMDQA